MAKKKPDYAGMYTLRSDGRYMGWWHELEDGEPIGPRHAIYDRDPERLYNRIREKETELPPVLTFEAAAAAWDTKHAQRIGAKTAETYKAPLRRCKDHFRGETAAEVTAQEIQAFLVELGKQGFSRRSVQMHRDILNMIFNTAILSGDLTVNPCAAVTLPRNLPSRRRELPPDAAIEAVRNGASQPFGLFALICLYAGLRRGEVLALTYEDIDREARVIHVTRAVEFVGNTAHLKPPKTAAGVRDVPLLAPLAAVLPEGKGLVFPGTDGHPLSKTQYRKRWTAYCKAIGYDITAHQLRHGYATILFEAGVQDKDAQEFLGHSSIAVTRDIYTHIRTRHRQETVKRLDAYLQPEKPKPKRYRLLSGKLSKSSQPR